MNISKRITSALALIAVAGCSSNAPDLQHGAQPTAAPGAKYTQIERLSRPAIKEAFESFQHHQISNAVEPYKDPTIQGDIKITEDAIRPPNATVGTDYGAALASVLYPDEYLVNLTGSTPTGADPYYFLSAEVDGTSAFGGRAPNDDVISLELGALFGKTLSAIGLLKDDGEENNCLSTQNVASLSTPAKSTTSKFPYLPAAR